MARTTQELNEQVLLANSLLAEHRWTQGGQVPDVFFEIGFKLFESSIWSLTAMQEMFIVHRDLMHEQNLSRLSLSGLQHVKIYFGVQIEYWDED